MFLTYTIDYVTPDRFFCLRFNCQYTHYSLSTDTVLSSNAFHKSTTLALKNFCPSVPFLFLNNVYLCPRVTLLGANSKNLSDCIDSFPVSYRLRLSLLWSFFSPVLLAHTLSTVPRNLNTYSLESFLWLFFVLSPVFPYPVSGMDSIPGCSIPTVAFTNDLYNLSIVSLSLVTIVLLIIPKVELAFLDASAHCLDGFALLCMITPKSLSSSLTFNTLPPITYDNSLFPFPMCITEHFSRLNSICQSCDHLNILLRSSRSISTS